MTVTQTTLSVPDKLLRAKKVTCVLRITVKHKFKCRPAAVIFATSTAGMQATNGDANARRVTKASISGRAEAAAGDGVDDVGMTLGATDMDTDGATLVIDGVVTTTYGNCKNRCYQLSYNQSLWAGSVVLSNGRA